MNNLSVKKILIGVVVAVIVIVGISYLVIKNKDNGGGTYMGEEKGYVPFKDVETKKYEAPEYGLSFSYPTDFVLQESRVPEKRVMVAGKEEVIPPVLNVTLAFENTVYALAVNNPSVGFDDFSEPKEDWKIDGHQVLHNSYDDYDADKQLLVYFMEDSNNQFYWLASIQLNDQEAKQTLEDIIRTTKFTPPQNAK